MQHKYPAIPREVPTDDLRIILPEILVSVIILKRGCLTDVEVAEQLEVTPDQINRAWRKARKLYLEHSHLIEEVKKAKAILLKARKLTLIRERNPYPEIPEHVSREDLTEFLTPRLVEIVLLKREKIPIAEIAKKHDIGKQYVYQLLAKARRKYAIHTQIRNTPDN